MWKRRVTITVNQVEGDPDFKRLIRELSKSKHPENVYTGRSESDIVKMLILGPLQEQHRRFVETDARAPLAEPRPQEA
jgi:hypothetical protein